MAGLGSVGRTGMSWRMFLLMGIGVAVEVGRTLLPMLVDTAKTMECDRSHHVPRLTYRT